MVYETEYECDVCHKKIIKIFSSQWVNGFYYYMCSKECENKFEGIKEK